VTALTAGPGRSAESWFSMYQQIYVPVDNSDHSNAAIAFAVALARRHPGARVTGCHVYAARMHDVRFKQMEYTLPAEYQDEQELERQRKIHDSLITRGLQLISDSYLDVLKAAAEPAGVAVDYKTFDGKNWECLAQDIADSDYDLVVMGALGMGAVKDSQLGSVTERVVRRTKVDTLVIRDTGFPRDGGPDRIVVGVDGSPQSFAAVRMAIELARTFGKRVEAVAVYDPYLHYSMFNGIVDVLSAEASKVFRFKEQEQLHEEIIDTGLAKIYQSHLRVAESVARDDGVELETTLLDGKAFKKLLQHVRQDPPWLLMVGRVGVHSGPEMDIGSNAENLLRLAPCSVLLSSRTFVPPVDVQAEAAVSWTDEAMGRLEEVPAHVRGVVRSAICRYALERGYSVISSSIIDSAIGDLMPERHAARLGVRAAPRPASMPEAAGVETWVCRRCGRPAREHRPPACPVCGVDEFQRVDKAAVTVQAAAEGGVEDEESFDGFRVRWTADGRRALEAVPRGYERRRVKAIIEKRARTQRLPAITREFAEANLDDAYAPVAEVVAESADAAAGDGPGVATAAASGWVAAPRGRDEEAPAWTDEASSRLERVPAGFMRSLAKTKVEEFARRIGATTVDGEVVEGGLADARELMGQMLRAYGPGGADAAAGVPGHGRVPAAPDVRSPSPGWTEDGVRRLNEVEVRAAEKFDPGRARELARHAAESRAERTSDAINAAFLERLGLKLGYGHPLSARTYQHHFTWTPEAEERLGRVPEFCRELTRWRVEWTAFKRGLGSVITPETMDVKFDMWGAVSHDIQAAGPTMPWDEAASRRLERVPEFVKGQVIQAVEGNARALGYDRVTSEVLDRVIERWISTGDFHEGRYGFRA
jgi:nucleotide-binding universal stress UspA family protein/ribosomal protein L37E